MNETELWAARGRWLVKHMSECTTPDGRTVLELVEAPIWARPDGTLADYCAAVDDAMEAEVDNLIDYRNAQLRNTLTEKE